MKFKGLISQLKLAYAPITAYEFAKLRNNIYVGKALEEAGLYVIAQRPVITFENFFVDDRNYLLHFEIHQKNNPDIIRCTLPLIQDVFGLVDGDMVIIASNFLDKTNKQDSYPLNNIHDFSLGKKNENKMENNSEFLVWFSPEKLLQNW